MDILDSIRKGMSIGYGEEGHVAFINDLIEVPPSDGDGANSPTGPVQYVVMYCREANDNACSVRYAQYQPGANSILIDGDTEEVIWHPLDVECEFTAAELCALDDEETKDRLGNDLRLEAEVDERLRTDPHLLRNIASTIRKYVDDHLPSA